MRDHEKARVEEEGRREVHRGEEEDRTRQGEEAGGEDGGDRDREGRALPAGAHQGRRLAAVPLPAPVSPGARRRRASMLRLLGLLLALLVAAPHCTVSAEDRPLRLVTF